MGQSASGSKKLTFGKLMCPVRVMKDVVTSEQRTGSCASGGVSEQHAGGGASCGVSERPKKYCCCSCRISASPYYASYYASYHGHLDCLERVYKANLHLALVYEGSREKYHRVWDGWRLIANAASRNHLDCLKFLHKTGARYKKTVLLEWWVDDVEIRDYVERYM